MKKTQPIKKQPLSIVETIINNRLDKTKELLLIKGKEYVRNEDRLHHFRRASEMERKSMPRVLHGMLQKHLVSYYDMLDDVDNGKMPSESMVNEKIEDIVVYFLLQEAVIKETINKK